MYRGVSSFESQSWVDPSSTEPLAKCFECGKLFRKHEGKVVWINAQGKAKAKGGSPKADDHKDEEIKKLRRQLAEAKKEGNAKAEDEEVVVIDEEREQASDTVAKC